MRESEAGKKVLRFLAKYKYVLIVILAGVLLLAIQSRETAPPESVPSAGAEDAPSDAESLSAFEAELEDILGKIEGVGEVRVMLTLRVGTERLYAQDTDLTRDASGEFISDQRSETVLFSVSSGGQQALLLREDPPRYRGALVVCQGGNSAKVQMTVVQAVSALTGLGSDKIQVTKMS